MRNVLPSPTIQAKMQDLYESIRAEYGRNIGCGIMMRGQAASLTIMDEAELMLAAQAMQNLGAAQRAAQVFLAAEDQPRQALPRYARRRIGG